MAVAQPEILWKSFLEAIAPDSKMSISEWAEERRILSSEGSARPGRWKNSFTPFLVEIMDALSPSSPTQEVVFMKGTQIGGSEAGFNFIGACIDLFPAPMIVVLPTDDLAKRSMSQRIEPMLDAVPSIAEKMAERKSKRSKKAVDSKLQKDFPSGTLICASATSKSAHRSMAAKYVYFDEVDSYPVIAEEGHPTELFKKRSMTFNRRKLFYCSSPKVKGISVIEEKFLESTQEYFQVPCPHCGGFQALVFEQLKWDEGKPESVSYECIHCKKAFYNKDKRKFLKKGKWVGDHPKRKVRGFHLSGLYSPVPNGSWANCIEDYIKAKGDREKMRTFVNTWLGLTFEEEEGEVPPWRHIYSRRESYKIGVVPEKAVYLTAAVDAQRDRLEMLVVGWNRQECFVVDYQVFTGNTSNPYDKAPFTDLVEALNKDYLHASGKTLRIESLGLDTSDNTSHLYGFVRRLRPTVFPLKGFDNQSIPATYGGECQIKSPTGAKRKMGMRLVKVGTSVCKDQVYNSLNLDAPTKEEIEDKGYPSNWIHFPEFEEDFFRMLCSEKKVAVFDKRRQRVVKHIWKKIEERNEILDLMVYNIAAAYLKKLPAKSEAWWKKREGVLGMQLKRKVKEPELRKKVKKKVTRKRKPRSFLD